MRKHTPLQWLNIVVVSAAVTLGTSTLLSASVAKTPAKAAIPPPPVLEKLLTLPQKKQEQWKAFCKALNAAKESAEAKKAARAAGAPEVGAIKRLATKDKQRWTSFCAQLLNGKGAKGASTNPRALPAPVKVRKPDASSASSRSAVKVIVTLSSSSVNTGGGNGNAQAAPVASSSVSSSMPSSASSSAQSSPLASSVSSSVAAGYKGACVIRDAYTSLPQYNAADAGTGYAKVGKGVSFTSYTAIRDVCVQADYTALGETFCDNNPGGSYQMQVAMYNQDDTYNTTGCASLGCQTVQCPAATGYKGACVVRDAYTSLPQYNAADAGQGYAKLRKGSGFDSYTALRDTCSQSDYAALGQTFCAQHPGGSYQMQAAIYNQDNTYQSTGCGNFGCNFVQCN